MNDQIIYFEPPSSIQNLLLSVGSTPYQVNTQYITSPSGVINNLTSQNVYINNITGPLNGLPTIRGQTGPQGVQGFQGSTGPQGVQGFQGTTGPQGVQGFQGATGPQGINGTSSGKVMFLNYPSINPNNPAYYLLQSSPTGGSSQTLNISFTSGQTQVINFATAYQLDSVSPLVSAGLWYTELNAYVGTIGQEFDIRIKVEAATGVSQSPVQLGISSSVLITSSTPSIKSFNTVVSSLDDISSNGYATLIIEATNKLASPATLNLQFLGTTYSYATTTLSQYFPQGPQGFQGSTGPQGVQGYQGSTGPQGVQGSTGPQGVQGFQGSTGPQGVQGFQGTTGPIGGLNTQIIYNNSGSASGDSTFTFNPTSKLVTVQSMNLTSGLTGTTQVYGNLAMNNYQIQNPVLKGVNEYVYVSTGVNTSYTVNCATGNNFNLTLSGNTVFNFINWPVTNTLQSVNLFLTQPSSGVTFYTGAFSGVSFGSQASYVSFSTGTNLTDVYSFFSYNNGGKILGFLSGKGF